MQSIKDVMTANPTVCSGDTTVADAARAMRDNDIGDVLVEQDGKVCGILTDRDIVIRGVADDRKPSETRLADICTGTLSTLSPNDSVEDAIRMMSQHSLRRIPVCQDGKAVGIVSIGDLAVERDATSLLADISAAPPND